MSHVIVWRLTYCVLIILMPTVVNTAHLDYSEGKLIYRNLHFLSHTLVTDESLGASMPFIVFQVLSMPFSPCLES